MSSGRTIPGIDGEANEQTSRTVEEIAAPRDVDHQRLLGVAVFFFQAEDGIGDVAVTGVQTCALPICPRARRRGGRPLGARRGSPAQSARWMHGQGSRPNHTAERPAATTTSARAPAANQDVTSCSSDRKSGGEGKRGGLGRWAVTEKRE